MNNNVLQNIDISNNQINNDKNDISNNLTEEKLTRIEYETNKILKEFLKIYEKNIIQACIAYRKQLGLGLLVVRLDKKSLSNLELEYYLIEQLPKKIIEKIKNHKDLKKTIFYSITFDHKTFFYEKTL